MNWYLILIVALTVSHVFLAYLFNRLQASNDKLRRSNAYLRKQVHQAESRLRFYSQKLTK